MPKSNKRSLRRQIRKFPEGSKIKSHAYYETKYAKKQRKFKRHFGVFQGKGMFNQYLVSSYKNMDYVRGRRGYKTKAERDRFDRGVKRTESIIYGVARKSYGRGYNSGNRYGFRGGYYKAIRDNRKYWKKRKH